MGSDFRSAFKKVGITSGGGGMTKKCKKCGKDFEQKNPKHDACSICFRENPTGDAAKGSLRSNYLEKGYFNENGKLREEIFKSEAKNVAEVLASQKMTPTSLRAFYNKVKAIENNYKVSKDFESIKPKLFAFERDATYQVSRGVVSEEFRKFIIKNAEIAQKGPDEFKGFIEHFLSVLAYFKDYSK